MKSLFVSSLKRAFVSKWYIASIIATVFMCYVSSRKYIDGIGTNSVYTIDLMIHLGMFKKSNGFLFFYSFCHSLLSRLQFGLYKNRLLCAVAKETMHGQM